MNSSTLKKLIGTMVTGKGHVTGQSYTGKLLNMESEYDENECTLLITTGPRAGQRVSVRTDTIIPVIKDSETNKAYRDILSNL